MCEENGEAMPLKLHSVRMLKQSSQASWRSFESFSCWWFNPTGWVDLCFSMLTSQSNRANLVFSSFILFFWLWPSRVVDLYFSPLYQWNSHYFVGFVKEKIHSVRIFVIEIRTSLAKSNTHARQNALPVHKWRRMCFCNLGQWCGYRCVTRNQIDRASPRVLLFC